MELKNSKTYENLKTAFAGESQARNKYTYFASKARKEGYCQIAKIFEEIANNEKEHAKIWYKLLTGGIDSTEKNLETVIKDEAYESENMYIQFAKNARKEGFDEIAILFEAVGKIENLHKQQYENLLKQLQTNRLFSKEENTIWICSNCGYSQVSMEAPDKCPVCSHPKAYFYYKDN